jgi:hypothetical protein
LPIAAVAQVSLKETESIWEAQRYVDRIQLCCPPGLYDTWADGDDSAENQKVRLWLLCLLSWSFLLLGPSSIPPKLAGICAVVQLWPAKITCSKDNCWAHNSVVLSQTLLHNSSKTLPAA